MIKFLWALLALVWMAVAAAAGPSGPVPYEQATSVQVEAYGAAGDARQQTLTLTVSGTALTSGSSVFAATDVGKTVVIPGAGAAGAVLTTTIAAYTNSTTITLGASASTALSAVPTWTTWGTDNSTAVAACITASLSASGECRFRNRAYLIGAATAVQVNQKEALTGPTQPEQDWIEGGSTLNWQPAIILVPGVTIRARGRLSGLFIVNAVPRADCAGDATGLQCVLATVAAFNGIGVTINGSAVIENSTIAGFSTCLSSTGGAYHWYHSNIVADCTSNLNAGISGDWNFGNGLLGKYVFQGPSSASLLTQTVIGAVSGTGSAVRLTVGTTANLAEGNVAVVNTIGGVTGAAGRWPIHIVDATRVELTGSTFGGTYTSGGTFTIKVSRAGPCAQFTDTVGQFGRIACYGWDSGVVINGSIVGTTWLRIGALALDNLNVDDPATTGVVISGYSFGTQIGLDYISSTRTPITINTTGASGTSPQSPHVFIGGDIYNTGNSPFGPSGITDISVTAGTAQFIGSHIPASIIYVGAAGQAIFSGVKGNGSTFDATSTFANYWIGDSQFGDVTGNSLRGALLHMMVGTAAGWLDAAWINATGAISLNASAPPTPGTCGTSPSITGTDNSMMIAVGTGGVTACTAAFASTHTAAPRSCTASAITSGGVPVAAAVKPADVTTGSVKITTAADVSGGTITAHCL